MLVQMNENTEKILTIIKCVAAMLCFWFAFFGVFFCIWKGNYNAAISSILLEIVSGQLLRLNVYYMKNSLLEKATPTTLRMIKILSLVFFILLFAGGIGDIYLGYKNEQGFHIEDDGYYYAAIPSFLGAIMSIILFFDSMKFIALFNTPNMHLQVM